MREIKSGVYKITNIINNKCYIGSSIDIVGRWRQHMKALRKGIHHSIHLQRAWNKDGEENFEFSIIEYITAQKEALIAKEQCYKDLYKSYDRKYGYDICPLAKSRLGSVGLVGSKNPMYGKTGNKHFGYGKVRSQEIRLKISETMIENGTSKGKNNGMYGRKHSDESKKKNSESNKIAQAGKNNSFYGKRHTDESKKKMSESRKRRLAACPENI